VESEPGRGSTFFFTLPTHRSACVVPESDDDVVLEPGRKVVLAVDDDRGVITLLKRYLEHEGYRVVGVVESPQAVDVARKLAPHLAAITLDIVMPRMDGWQVLQALRQEALTKDVPVILCSIVEGLEQGLEMGADLCLRKPVTRDEVLDALERVEQGGTRGERYSWPDRQGRE
ncbi:MAG: response regulator, partial [Anaerolineae bacterium]